MPEVFPSRSKVLNAESFKENSVWYRQSLCSRLLDRTANQPFKTLITACKYSYLFLFIYCMVH